MRKNLILSLLLGSLLVLPLSAQAAFKCWTNKDGVRECGNAVPPEYAQQQSETINERGQTVERQQRAKTAEELEQEHQREAEEARIKAEEERRLEEQRNHDRVLLATFLTEEDIIQARDRKLSSIDAGIELNRLTIDKLEGDLEREQKRAENYRRKEQETPESLQQAIDSLERQIADKKRYISSQQVERERLVEEYARDLERFRELKAAGRQLR